MTYVVFSFDTEDYVNPIGAQGVLRSAELLREEGITGSFNIVARIAQAFVKWGRADVLEALRHHEINTHSEQHSFHPTINEYTDIEDFTEAQALFLERERRAQQIIFEIMGVKEFLAACPPGNSTSYVAHYGYAEMGIPFYDGDNLFDARQGRPVMACNIKSLDYTFCLDEFLVRASHEEVDALLDRMAANKEICIFYHHPAMSYVSEFWDKVNFNGVNTPEDEWRLSARRPEPDTERFYENFRYLAQRVKHDPRFEPITYAGLAEIYREERHVITPPDLMAVKEQLEADFFPVTLPDSYCLSDLLLACRDFLQGQTTHECGTVYGFLDTPYAAAEPVTVTAEEMRASAAQIGDGFLPERLVVGGSVIGPADWLRAALLILSGAEQATVQPGPWQIDLDEFPDYRDLQYRNSWVHSRALEDRYLSNRFRLQSWTIRLPKGSARRIF